MNVLKLCASASLLVIATFLGGCTGECARASDCAATEVCYAGNCEPGSEEILSNLCTSDMDCNGDGTGLVCKAGRCRPDDTIVPKVDAGPVGPPDMGMMMDMGPADTGTSAPDMGSGIPIPDMG